MIRIHPDGQLSTDLYRKPTAGNTLIHTSSAHPHPLTSITYAQYLRLCRICMDEVDFHQQANALHERFLQRGFFWAYLEKGIE